MATAYCAVSRSLISTMRGDSSFMKFARSWGLSRSGALDVRVHNYYREDDTRVTDVCDRSLVEITLHLPCLSPLDYCNTLLTAPPSKLRQPLRDLSAIYDCDITSPRLLIELCWLQIDVPSAFLNTLSHY